MYDEMVMKIFINTIAKPHVKRLSQLRGGHLCGDGMPTLRVVWKWPRFPQAPQSNWVLRCIIFVAPCSHPQKGTGSNNNNILIVLRASGLKATCTEA